MDVTPEPEHMTVGMGVLQKAIPPASGQVFSQQVGKIQLYRVSHVAKPKQSWLTKEVRADTTTKNPTHDVHGAGDEGTVTAGRYSESRLCICNGNVSVKDVSCTILCPWGLQMISMGRMPLTIFNTMVWERY